MQIVEECSGLYLEILVFLMKRLNKNTKNVPRSTFFLNLYLLTNKQTNKQTVNSYFKKVSD